MFHESLNEATGGCKKGNHAGQNYLSRNERGCGKLSYSNLEAISKIGLINFTDGTFVLK